MEKKKQTRKAERKSGNQLEERTGINFFPILGRLFTDKNVTWEQRESSSHKDSGLQKVGSEYLGSKTTKQKTSFEDFEVHTLGVVHKYRRTPHDDYGYNWNDSSLRLTIEKGQDTLVLEGTDIDRIRSDIFKELKVQRSLGSYWQGKGILKFPPQHPDFYDQTILVNGEEYRCRAKELEITLGVPSVREEQKSSVDLAEAVRFSENKFWQPYVACIRVARYHPRGDFDDEIKARVIMDVVRNLIVDGNENPFLAFKGNIAGWKNGEVGVGIYMAHRNIIYHEGADALIQKVEGFQDKRTEIQKRIWNLKDMPYTKLKKSLPEELPVGGKQFLSLP